MKTTTLRAALPAVLLAGCLAFSSCLSDDTPKDKIETITMEVSSQTDVYYPWGSTLPEACMLMRTQGANAWQHTGFSTIHGFNYDLGNAYVLKVKRTTLGNPPADGSQYTYELDKEVSRKQECTQAVAFDASTLSYVANASTIFYTPAVKQLYVDSTGAITDESGNPLELESDTYHYEYATPESANTTTPSARYFATGAYVVNEEGSARLIPAGCTMRLRFIVPQAELKAFATSSAIKQTRVYTIYLLNSDKEGIQRVSLVLTRK